jgi:hypothetical protein
MGHRDLLVTHDSPVYPIAARLWHAKRLPPSAASFNGGYQASGPEPHVRLEGVLVTVTADRFGDENPELRWMRH